MTVQATFPTLASVDPKHILARVLALESTTDIANSYGVSRPTLNLFLLATAEQEWKDAQLVRALERKESAEQQLECAQDALTLARGRELLKSAQWDLERVCRRIYGVDHASAAGPGVQINVNISPRTSNPVSVDAQVIESKDASTDS